MNISQTNTTLHDVQIVQIYDCNVKTLFVMKFVFSCITFWSVELYNAKNFVLCSLVSMKNKGAKFDLLVLECPVSYMLWFEYIYIKCNNCFLFIRPWVPSDGNHNDKLTYAVLNKKILIKRPTVIIRWDYMVSRMKHRQIHMRKKWWHVTSFDTPVGRPWLFTWINLLL